MIYLSGVVAPATNPKIGEQRYASKPRKLQRKMEKKHTERKFQRDSNCSKKSWKTIKDLGKTVNSLPKKHFSLPYIYIIKLNQYCGTIFPKSKELVLRTY